MSRPGAGVIDVRPGMAICYECFGRVDDPALVLIAGLGAQMLSWDRRLCERLAEGGRRVIRFDNRDCGLSSVTESEPVDLQELIAAATGGDLDAVRRLASYTLHDMADDTAALLDALAIEHAHIVGASMGGMIAQLVAVRHPRRTATLTSISSSTGEADVGQSTPEAFAALLQPVPDDRDAHVAAAVAAARTWGSRRYFDEDQAASLAGASYDRSGAPSGLTRQLAALLATGSLALDLTTISAPTLVIHGLDDTLIDPTGGLRTAELVPGAELLLLDDMGHDRPEPLWPALTTAILGHTSAPS